MKKLISTAALVLSSTLLLSACGDKEEEKAPAPETSQTAPEKTEDAPVEKDESDFDTAGMQEITGDAYSLYIPEDWKEAPGGAEGFLDMNYANPDATQSINMVVVPETPFGSEKEAQAAITKELKAANFTNVEFPGNAEVDGEEGPVATAETTIGEETFYTYQVLMVKDGKNHVLTVGGFDKAEIEKTGKQVVESWTWS